MGDRLIISYENNPISGPSIPAHLLQAAAMMAKPSLKSMSLDANSPSHFAWIHSSPYMAPKPWPEASVNRHMSEVSIDVVCGIMEDEFQLGSHSHHQ